MQIHFPRHGVLRIIEIFFALLLSSNSYADAEVSYQAKEIAPFAHKLMHDNGVNALYFVVLKDVEQFLPKKLPIKKSSVRIANHIRPFKIGVGAAHHKIFKTASSIKHANASEFFRSFRENVPYTFAIVDSELRFTESTALPFLEKYRDRFSKHYLISGQRHRVNFAGEMRIIRNTDTDDVYLIFDNASGTYQPPSPSLSNLAELLRHNFGGASQGTYFVTKAFNQQIDKEKLFAGNASPFNEDNF